MKPVIVLVLAVSVAVCMTGSEYLAWAASPHHAARPDDPARPAAPATNYDASWFKAKGWPGEWPDGFTMADNVTLGIRPTLDLNASKSVSCALRKGATYHPWNRKRIASDGLEFLSFTRIETYEFKESYTAHLARRPDGKETTIEFKKGDQ